MGVEYVLYVLAVIHTYRQPFFLSHVVHNPSQHITTTLFLFITVHDEFCSTLLVSSTGSMG